MEQIIIIGALIFSVGLAYALHKAFDDQIGKIATKYRDKLTLEYPNLFEGQYKFYTDNHPYVWEEVPEEEFINLIKAAATGARGVPLDPPICCYKINIESEKFYFVAGKRNFNFSSRMHYHEWLDGQKEVAQNIAKHKNS